MKGITRLSIGMVITIIAVIIMAALLIWLAESFFGTAMTSNTLEGVLG